MVRTDAQAGQQASTSSLLEPCQTQSGGRRSTQRPLNSLRRISLRVPRVPRCTSSRAPAVPARHRPSRASGRP